MDDAEVEPVRVYPCLRYAPDLADDRSSPVYRVVSSKVWSDDGNTLAFHSKYGVSGWRDTYEVYCVVVDFEEGKTPNTYAAPIMVADFVKPGSKPDCVAFSFSDYISRTASSWANLAPMAMYRIEKGEFVGVFTPQPHWKQDTVRVPVDSVRNQTPITAN